MKPKTEVKRTLQEVIEISEWGFKNCENFVDRSDHWTCYCKGSVYTGKTPFDATEAAYNANKDH